MELKPFTVVLLYPDWAADNYGEDSYTAHVEATTRFTAIEAAQSQAYEAFRRSEKLSVREIRDLGEPPDFYGLVVFEGHIEPVAFGWQL